MTIDEFPKDYPLRYFHKDTGEVIPAKCIIAGNYKLIIDGETVSMTKWNLRKEYLPFKTNKSANKGFIQIGRLK